jgi:peptide/nickel transport system permease protein
MPDRSPSDARLLEPTDAPTVIPEAPAAPPVVQVPARKDEAAEGYVKRKLGLGFWLAAGWIFLLVLGALLAPWLTARGILKDPISIDTARLYAKVSNRSWFGTDSLGRDQFSRIVWGARVSLPVGFAAIFLGIVFGGAIGLATGYLKGWVDTTFMAVMDVILAFPALLLALSIVTFMDRNDVPTISLAIGLIAIPGIARLVRANTLTFREREFVLAARTLGATHGRIIVREILPNVLPPVLSFAVVGVAGAIAAEAALAFVGVSVPLPTATWGGMIFQASAGDGISSHPFQVFLPASILVITTVSLYILGDRIGQYLDAREGAL